MKPVAHDTARKISQSLGTSLFSRCDHADSMHNKSDEAAAAMAEWLDSFDVLAHYKRAMLERADRLKREAAEMSKAARAIRLPRQRKES